MNEAMRKRPAGSALPGQTQDDQSIPILTERLTLPPLDLDTTLPDIAPVPFSLQLPPAPEHDGPKLRALPSPEDLESQKDER